MAHSNMPPTPSPSGFCLDSTPFSSTSRTSSRTSSTSSLGALNALYPAPLPRSDFLTPHFSAQTYLSSLGHRHQTLEDLRSDLRTRSQNLHQELLDLVNDHYDDFLGLGGSLRGGEEAVEGVRVGVLGLRREVEGVRGVVGDVEVRVGRLVEERGALRSEIERGRKLVDWDGRLEVLERRLGGTTLKPGGERGTNDVDEDATNEDEESDDDSGIDLDLDSDDLAGPENDESWAPALQKASRRVHNYQTLQHIARRIGEEHPMLVAQRSRMMRVRNTILLDLSNVLKHIKAGGAGAEAGLLKVMGLYRDMDAEKEAVVVLRDIGRKGKR